MSFSSKDDLVAAIAHDGKIGVWEVATEKLRFIVQAPAGYVTNFPLRFNRDGTQLAYAGEREAKFWNTTSGELLQEPCALNPALTGTLGFHESGKWLLFRVETNDGKIAPIRGVNATSHPRVCRFYEIGPDNDLRKVKEITDDFDEHVHGAIGSEDASAILVDGQNRSGKRVFKIFDGLTGSERVSRVNYDNADTNVVKLDPTGQFAGVRLAGARTPITIIDLATGLNTDHWDPTGDRRQFPTLRYAVANGGATLYGPDDVPAFFLTKRSDVNPNHAQSAVAVRNADGTVTVWHMEQLRDRMKGLGLGW